MLITGTFTDNDGRIVSLAICSGGDRSQVLRIGDGEEDLWLDGDCPVRITGETDAATDVLRRQSCTIRLLTPNIIPEVIAPSALDVAVTVERGGDVLFAGYVEPHTYEQPYAGHRDVMELNCIDALTAMHYIPYVRTADGDVGDRPASAWSAEDLLTAFWQQATAPLALLTGGVPRLWYDGSRWLANAAGTDQDYGLFGKLMLHGRLFCPSAGKGSGWSQRDVLEELLQLFSLHAWQDGLSLRIMADESLTADATIGWKDLMAANASPWMADVYDETPVVTRRLTADLSRGTDGRLSVSQAWNKMSVDCRREQVATLVPNPLESSRLTSDYAARQLMLTEYAADGDGETALRAFYETIGTDYVPTVGDHRAVTVTDVFAWARRAEGWTFFDSDGQPAHHLFGGDLAGRQQQRIPRMLAAGTLRAALLSIGTVERERGHSRRESIRTQVRLTDTLLIHVGGNWSYDNPHPTADELRAMRPAAAYADPEGASAGSLTPPDAATTFYVVFSGKALLTPAHGQTAPYDALRDHLTQDGVPGDIDLDTYWHRVVPSPTNGDGQYLTRRYYQADAPTDEPADSHDQDGWHPATTRTGHELKVDDSFTTSGRLLRVMLRVGDKCAVETDAQGRPESISWQQYKTLGQLGGDADAYYAQSFVLRFDALQGHYAVGEEMAIHNNVTADMDIDAEGTAIAIKAGDALAGQVELTIVGVEPCTLGQWPLRTYSIPAYTDMMALRKFEVKIVSDNAHAANQATTDLTYTTAATPEHTHERDGVTFRLHSALTADEALAMRLTSVPCLSIPTERYTGQPLTTVYDRLTGQTAHPEQLFLDQLYRRLHLPRITCQETLHDDGRLTPLTLFTRQALPSRTFMLLKADRDVMAATARVTLAEIPNQQAQTPS